MIGLLATFGGVGYLRPAPGTWGSFAALLVGAGLFYVIEPVALAIATLLVAIFGAKICDLYMQAQDAHDPSEVVIDEALGQWIAMAPVLYWYPVISPVTGALLLGAFVTFRLFDILKPGPIGHYDRRQDAYGVMMDDVVAGVFAAALISAAIATIWWFA